MSLTNFTILIAEAAIRWCSAKQVSLKRDREREAVAQKCCVKEVFLKMSKNSQVHACTGASFIIAFHNESCKNPGKTYGNFFYRTPPSDCFYNCFCLLEVMVKMRWNYNIKPHGNFLIKVIAANQNFLSKNTGMYLFDSLTILTQRNVLYSIFL